MLRNLEVHDANDARVDVTGHNGELAEVFVGRYDDPILPTANAISGAAGQSPAQMDS